MGRKVDVDQLVGAMEIAQRLGVKRPQVVYGWRSRSRDTDLPFPTPVAELSIGHVFVWSEVEAWARSTGRL